MRNKDYLFKNVKKVNKGYISLKKKPQKSSLISYSIKIKNNLNSKIFIDIIEELRYRLFIS